VTTTTSGKTFSETAEPNPLRNAPPQDLRGTRILVIMPSVPVQGMERSNLQIMKMLRQRGADVLFVVERRSPDVAREAESIGCDVAPATFYQGWERRLHLSRDPFEMAGVVGAWARTAAELDRIYRQYKPTHIHVTNLHYFLDALPTLWRARCPVVFRLPNPPDTMLPRVKQAISDWIWRKLVLPWCDAVVCNCRYTFSRLERLGLPPERGHCIYNCLADRTTNADDMPSLRSHCFNVVYLGRIRPEKGVGQLCEAAARIVRERPDVDFHLAGEYAWENPFAEELIRKVRAEKLNERIQFHGPIQDVFGLLGRCHLHVCPSTNALESFPNVILEAKSQGLPSVVFPTSGIPEAVTHLVDGYVCRDTSAEALYEGMRHYLDQPDESRRAGDAARRSLARFSEQTVGNQWAELYLGLGRSHFSSGLRGPGPVSLKNFATV